MNRNPKKLNLKQKYGVIQMLTKEKKNVMEVAVYYNCGKTQINDIIKQKEKIIEKYLFEYNNNMKKKKHHSGYYHLNNIVFEWVLAARERNISISDPLLQQKAKEIANLLNVENFLASDEWLENFKKGRNISFNVPYQQDNNINKNSGDDWSDKLKNITRGYANKDIGTADEIILFYKALPNQILQTKTNEYIEIKNSKERISLFLIAYADGKLEKPLVIGKHTKPKCFENLNLNKLPVIYKSNKNVTISSTILEEFLIDLNRKMKKENRNILLFFNNTIIYSKIRLSNIKIIYFPTDELVLQPFSNGIKHHIKFLYRRSIIKVLLINMTKYNTDTNLNFKLNILDAINILNFLLQSVDKNLIQMCFKNCGFDLNISNQYKIVLSDNDFKDVQVLIENLYRTKKINLNIEDILNFDDILDGNEKNDEDEKKDEGNDEESDDENNEILTITQILKSTKLLKKFAKRNGEDEFFYKVVELEFFIQNIKRLQ